MSKPHSLPRLLRESFYPRSPCLLRRVPIELLLDRVLLRLAVTDIIRLRRVDKAFFVLTHSVTIWKQFFRDLEVPTPLFCENANRFAFDDAEHEYERLVAKCISLDDTWRSIHPRVGGVNTTYIGMEMLEMKIMPGGHYLFGSVRKRPHDPTVPSYYGVVVFKLGGLHSTPTLIFSLDIGIRAYQIQARFMIKQRRDSLVISFVTRQHHPSHRNPYDLSELTYEEPRGSQVDYTWHCGYIPIAELVDADNRNTLLRAWYHICTRHHTERILCSSLFMLNTFPFAAFVEDPDVLVVCRLDNVTFTTTKLYPWIREATGEEEFSRVHAIRALPSQGVVIVVRTFYTHAQGSPTVVQVYHMFNTVGRQKPLEDFVLNKTPNEIFCEIIITEPPLLRDIFEVPGLDECPSFYAPPPISIYAITRQPNVFKHWVIWPAEDNREFEQDTDIDRRRPPLYNIKQPYFVIQPRYVFETLPFDVGILPGIHRPLIYHYDLRSPHVLTDLRRYQPRWTTNRVTDNAIAVIPRREPLVKRSWQSLWQPTYSFASLELIPDQVFARLQEQESSSLSWDETSGRLCVASAPDLRMTIIDIGTNIERNANIHVWKEERPEEKDMDISYDV